MMAVTQIFVAVLATLVQTSSAGTAGLRASPAADSKLVETVRALDKNGNGKVDMSELTGFAKSQGLSTQEVLADFKELDVNKDGALDASEIGPLFGVDGADVAEVSPKDPAMAVETKPVAAVAVAVVAAPKLAEKKPRKQAQAAAKKAAPQPENSMGIDLVALEQDAQEQAGGVIAKRLAERAQVLLARSSADERKAEAFDTAVKTLRGNATALSHQANKQTREASRSAVSAVSKKSMAELQKLQAAEHKAEAAAEEHREQARMALERVHKAQASLRSA